MPLCLLNGTRKPRDSSKRDLPNYQKAFAKWQKLAAENEKAGKPAPPDKPYYENYITSQCRPANLYNARLRPIAPYRIKGVIWYQGESNVGRADQYVDLFSIMVRSWRAEWGQGDFPIYWVQLADYLPEQDLPGESDWAALRNAQTLCLDHVPNSGQVISIDVGDADDIHPGDKRSVAQRLARLALAKTYGVDVACESPMFEPMRREPDSIVLKFSVPYGRLETRDGQPVRGFALRGGRRWAWADATIIGADEIRIATGDGAAPTSVRYAWADNPVCNLRDAAELPAAPFQADIDRAQ